MLACNSEQRARTCGAIPTVLIVMEVTSIFLQVQQCFAHLPHCHRSVWLTCKSSLLAYKTHFAFVSDIQVMGF